MRDNDPSKYNVELNALGHQGKKEQNASTQI